MAESRRQFLRNSGLLIGAAAVSPLGLQVVAAPGAPCPLSEEDQTVLDFVRSHSREFLLRGGCVPGRMTGARPSFTVILASLEDVAQLADAYTASLFGDVHATGNTFSFTSGGRFVSIEYVPAVDFPKRLAGISRGQGLNFAHEAVTFDPASGEVRDPWQAMAGSRATLKLLGHGKSGADGLDQLIQGLLDEARYGLKPDRAFTVFKTRLLASRPATIIAAQDVAESFVSALAPLAAVLPVGDLNALAASRLVSTSLSAGMGLTATRLVANATRLRATGRTRYAPGSYWLASAFGSRLVQQRSRLWISDSDRYGALQTKAALVEAAQIVAQAPFIIL